MKERREEEKRRKGKENEEEGGGCLPGESGFALETGERERERECLAC